VLILDRSRVKLQSSYESGHYVTPGRTEKFLA